MSQIIHHHHHLAPFQLLELNVISAQDLAPVSRNMRTYAVAWVHPERKLSTQVDTQGHTNPTWNDKFVFRVDDRFLYADTSAIMIEIYALHWFRDIHVGTVRILIGNLIPPPSLPGHDPNRPPLGMRFVALQVRRPSGRPQGILNIGVTVLDSSKRSMPQYMLNSSAVGYRHLMGEKAAHNHLTPQAHVIPKPELRRSKSDSSSMIGPEAIVARHQREIANIEKANSAVSGSEVSSKRKGKRKSKRKPKSDDNSSILSSSVLSDSFSPWKVKNGRTPEIDDGNYNHHVHDDNVHVEVEVERPQPPTQNGVTEFHDHDDNADSTVNSISEAAASEIHSNTNHEYVHVNNVAYQVVASPKPQFRNSPAPEHFKNSPAPENFRNPPAPAHYRSSPAPAHFRNSPVSAQFRNSPTPQFKNSPAPQFRNSPAPQIRNSPAPQFKNSPMPQFVNSPKPQFRNSPVVAAATPQYRNSPMVSKFNPALGYGGGSRMATPMHHFGTKFEYSTPMRSNLGNMRPVTMTESELGPSPSEVAAAMARKPVIDEGENSTVGGWSLDESVEGLESKLDRWQTDLPPITDGGEHSTLPATTPSAKTSRHSRRHTDGGNGLFSCFSNICGVECSIVCGGDPKGKKNRRRRTSSADTASFV